MTIDELREAADAARQNYFSVASLSAVSAAWADDVAPAAAAYKLAANAWAEACILANKDEKGVKAMDVSPFYFDSDDLFFEVRASDGLHRIVRVYSDGAHLRFVLVCGNRIITERRITLVELFSIEPPKPLHELIGWPW